MKVSQYNIFFKYKNNYLLANTFTGAVFTISDNIKEALKSNNFTTLSKNDIEIYKKTGILINDDVNEYNIYQYSVNRESYNNTVLSLTILLTRNCNFKCIYCFEGQKKETKTMNESTKKSILFFIENVLLQNKNIKIVSITLFGGEPLLGFCKNYEWLESIKLLCTRNKKKFETIVITNGSLFTNKILDELHKLNCKSIQITLDGIEDIHNKRRTYINGKGSFNDVINGIKSVVQYKKLNNPIIRINIDKTNLNQTKELLKYISEHGLSDCFIDFGIVKDIGNNETQPMCFSGEEIGKALFPLWKYMTELGLNFNYRPLRLYNYCGLSKENFYTIDVNGDVYKCWELVGQKEFIIGQISKEGHLINTTQHLVDCLCRNSTFINECKKCKYLPLCGCGCASVAIQKYNSLFKPGCFKTKHLFYNQLIMMIKK